MVIVVRDSIAHDLRIGQWLVAEQVQWDNNNTNNNRAMVAVLATGMETEATEYAQWRHDQGPCFDINEELSDDHKRAYIKRMWLNKRQLAVVCGAGRWQELMGDEPEPEDEEEEEDHIPPPSVVGSIIRGFPLPIVGDDGEINIITLPDQKLQSHPREGHVAVSHDGKTIAVPVESARAFIVPPTTPISASLVNANLSGFLRKLAASSTLPEGQLAGEEIIDLAAEMGEAGHLLEKLVGMGSTPENISHIASMILIHLEIVPRAREDD